MGQVINAQILFVKWADWEIWNDESSVRPVNDGWQGGKGETLHAFLRRLGNETPPW